MDNIPDAIYFKNAEGRFICVNQAQATVLGLADPHQAEGKSDFDFFDTEHAQAARVDEERLLQSGQPIINKEERLRRPDGQWRWVSATKVPLRNDDGRICGLVGISRDITDYHHAVAGVRRTEDVYRHAIAGGGAVVYCRGYQPDAFTFIGEEIVRLTGYTSAEMTPQLWESLILEAHFAGQAAGMSYEQAVRLVRDGQMQEWRSDCRIRAKDGDIRWIADSSIEVLNDRGVPTGSLGILQDITDRKRMEEQLRHSEARLSALFASIGDAVLVLSAWGEFLEIPTTNRSLLYKTREELLGRTLHQVFPQEKADYFLRHIQSALQERRSTEIEYSLDIAGKLTWFAATLSPMSTDAAVVVVARDITERKRAEQERELLIEKLQAAVSQVKALSGLLPICSSCKKVRDDRGYWNQIESYIQRHSDAQFSHGLCPDCISKYFPDYTV